MMWMIRRTSCGRWEPVVEDDTVKDEMIGDDRKRRSRITVEGCCL